MKTMKKLASILIFGLLIISCNSSKESIKTTEQTEEITESKNPFSKVCECKNSKGYSIEEYGIIMSKESNLSIEEYAQSIPALMSDQENWLFKEFFFDEEFITNIESFSENSTAKNEDPEDAEKMMQEAMKKYPICFQAFPYIITLAKRK